MKKDPLQEIPGVGPAMTRDLHALGIESFHDLEGQEPEELYSRLQVIVGHPIDRCVLYVFRSAVYYAEGGRDSEMVKWWNWKDARKNEWRWR